MKTHLVTLGAVFLSALVNAQAPPAGQPAVVAPTATPAAAPATQQSAMSIMPDVISTYGGRVDELFYLILWITLFMLVLVFVLFGVFVVKYRYQEGRKAIYVHGNNKLEVFWTIATAAVLIWLVFAQRSTWIEIKQKDLKSLGTTYKVRVFGEQFNWHFVYPGTDGKFEPTQLEDVFQGINPVGLKDKAKDLYSPILMVPENVPVVLELNSQGKFDQDTRKETLPVLHSFFSPNLRFKQDIVPFHPAQVWFQVLPGKAGKYEIACAELCGLGHYTMRTDFMVMGDEALKTALGYDWKAYPAEFSPIERGKK